MDHLNHYEKPAFIFVAWMLVTLSLMTPSSASATNKCMAPDKTVLFSDAPCPENTTNETVNIRRASGNAGETSIHQWDKYCVATFTRDFVVKSMTGDERIRVAKGDRYLLSGITPLGFFMDTILYPQEGGVISYAFKNENGKMDSPFTTDCNEKNTKRHVGVFADVLLFTDPEFTRKACVVKKGNIFTQQTFSIEVHLGNVASIKLRDLGKQCGGHEILYYKVSTANVSGFTEMITPFATIVPK